MLPERVDLPSLKTERRTVIDDQTREDLRGLFDWRSAAPRLHRPGAAAATSGVANDDLALALQLLSCNSRDREQFISTRGDADTAA